MEEDEDVVFENSPLHEHLRDIGFSEDDVQPEQLHRPKKENTRKVSSPTSRSKSYKHIPSLEQLKNQFYGYIFDEAWHNQVRQLYVKNTRHIVDEILKSPVIGEEDAAYAESFASAISLDQSLDSGDGILGQIMTQVGVLAVTMAYGFFRMFYLKHAEFVSTFYVYILDVLSIIMTVVALAPAALKFATVGRLVSQLQVFVCSTLTMVGVVDEFERLAAKTTLFVQEIEIVQRGFTLITAPVSRLELGTSGGRQQRHCPNLRRVLFHCSRHIMMSVKSATSQLLKQFPSNVEVDDVSNYLASLPLDEYGPSVNIPESCRDELLVATDDFCISSLKAMTQMMSAHISEFFRVLCMLCLLYAEDPRRSAVAGFVEQCKIVTHVGSEISDKHKPLQKSFVLHKNLGTHLRTLDKRLNGNPSFMPSSEPVALYTAVHSLCLHLFAALQRIQSVDNALETVVENGDCDLHDEIQTLLTSDLKLTERDLAACKDCCEEAILRLKKLQGNSVPASEVTCAQDSSEHGTSDAEMNDKQPLRRVIIPNCEPVSEDQVFEGYPEGDDSEPRSAPIVLSDEQKRDEREAMRLLSELRTVIAVRAEKTRERERNALLRQNPNYKFDENNEIPDIVDSVENETPTDPVLDRLCQRAEHPNDVYLNTGSRQMNSTESDHLPNSSHMFTKQVAMMAVAKSHHMASLSLETFGDSDNSDDNGAEESDDDISQ